MNALSPLSTNPADRGQRPLRTRAALLDAAERLFANRSIDAISIDDITTDARVAKGSFYNHFRSKQSIALEIAARTRAGIATSVALRVSGDWSAPEILARGGMAMLRYMLERPDGVRVLRQFSSSLTASSPLDAIVARALDRGIEDQSFRSVPREVALLLVTGVELAAAQRASAADFDVAALDQLKRLMEMMMIGLGVTSSEARDVVDAAAHDILSGMAITPGAAMQANRP